VHIKPETDLEAVVKLWVVSDRKLDLSRSEGAQVDEEGNVVAQSAPSADVTEESAGEARPAKAPKAEKAESAPKAEKSAKSKKG